MTNQDEVLELYYAEEFTEEMDDFGRIWRKPKWIKANKPVSLGSLNKPSNVKQILYTPKKRFSYRPT
jgi:hypothetical protein